MTTGTMANSEAANRYCHSIMLYPLKMLIPTVKGLRVSEEIRHRATVYSFQALMKIKINVVTMPGAATGSSTRSSACTRLQPSMVAACSISAEMLIKVPRSSQMVKA